jgi:acyl carrier protein
MTNGFSDPRAEAILDVIAKVTDVDRAALVPEATLEDLGIPSLDLTMAVFDIESHFDIELPVIANQDGAEFTTVGSLVAHVLATLDREVAFSTSAPIQAGKPALVGKH